MPPRSTRFPRIVAALASAFVCAASSTAALAAPKDKEAEKAYTQAMDEDYLNTQFDKAISKLKKAIGSCGKTGCSKQVLGKLHVGLGVVYGGGKENKAEAKSEFIKAFEADPKAKPVEDFMTPELKKIFDQAKKEAKAGGGDDDDDGPQPAPQPGPAPQPKGDDDDDGKGDDDDDAGGDVEYSPPKEALINTPLPIFIKFPDDIGAKDAKLQYKPFGGTKWMPVGMSRMAEGFGAEVPCSEVTTTGELKLYIIARDDAGDPIATAGTRKKPLTIDIKNKLLGEQPSFPGKKPPEQCVTAADCPPDFPGCEPTNKGGARGDKGWGATCEQTKECRKGFVCLNGSCEQGEGDDDDDDDDDTGAPAGPSSRQHIVTVGIGLDVLFLSSAEKVCGEANPPVSQGGDGKFESGPENFFCYSDEGEFLGLPAEADKTNEVVGGGALASLRIMAGYDWMFWDKGLAGGLRIGAHVPIASGSNPGVGNAEERFDDCVDLHGGNEELCRQPAAKKPLLLHLGGRVSYFLGGREGLVNGLVRPYAFVGGGVGQVNAGVTVKVCDRVNEQGGEIDPTVADGGCDQGRIPGTDARSNIKAVQVTGLGFVDLGIGSMFTPNVGPVSVGAFVEVKAMFMLPTFGVVLAPSIGPALLF